MIRYFCDVCDREMPVACATITAQIALKTNKTATIYLETSDGVSVCDQCLWRAMKAKVEGPPMSKGHPE